MTKVIQLTHEKLIELLDFDPATGWFVWMVARSNRVKVGSRAGVVHAPTGGRYISLGTEKFMAHRLAWFYVHKTWPNTDVRPNDGNYDNCAIENLKEVSRVELAHGRSKNKNNGSGFLGVSQHKGRWQASITWNYKQIHLGANFDTAEEASQTYADAAEGLKTASSQEEIDAVVAGVRLLRRQRATWKYINKQHQDHTWASFDAFREGLKEFPNHRYAMVPVDLSRAIGPDNFRWSLPIDATHNSNQDRNGYVRARSKANEAHNRQKRTKKIYGVDDFEFNRLMVEQKGLCAICEEPETRAKVGGDEARKLSIDHNHDTMAVRGLLCAQCNYALGQFGDSLKLLRKASAYMQKHEPDNVVKFEPSIVGGVMGNGA